MGVEKICNNPYYDFGDNIRYERKRRKFSIAYIAELTHFSVNYVGMLERNERTPSLEAVQIFCHLYDLTPNELLLPREGVTYKYSLV